MLVEVHRQFETAGHQVAGLRTFRTQLRRLLVDADHLPRQFLQPGLRVERLVVKFDPVPQLSNPAAPRLRAEEPRACRGDKTQLDMHAGHRRTHTQAHKRRHTYRKKKTDCVPTQPATRSKNKFPIASCVVPRSIECNTSMQMSSAENPGKEKRGLTLIPCSVWRARSSDVRYRDVLHAAAVEVSVQGMSLQLALHLQQISLDAHPLKPNKALYQAQSPRTWSSNAWHPKASFLRPRAARALSVPSHCAWSCRADGHDPARRHLMLQQKMSTMASSVHLPPHPHPQK